MNLFSNKAFVSHSKIPLNFKIQCEALSSSDLQTLAEIIASKISFRRVFGIPRGGMDLAFELVSYEDDKNKDILIIDDVCTTGKSFEDMKSQLIAQYGYQERYIKGICIFARGECPYWVTPIFSLDPLFR